MSKDFLECLKILLSWPVMTLTIFIIFGKPLTTCLATLQALLERPTVKVDLKGFSIEAAHAQIDSKPTSDLLQIAGPEIDSETRSRIENIKRIGTIPVLQQQVKSIENDLNKIHVGEKETIELLTMHLAATQLVLLAEQVYRLIFGSQILLLKLLNTSGAIPEEKLRHYYEDVKSRQPEFYATYSFEGYMGFMASHRLISKEGEYTITVIGKEFLKWITDAGVPENKPF